MPRCPGFKMLSHFISRRWPGSRTRFFASSARNTARTCSPPNSFRPKEFFAGTSGPGNISTSIRSSARSAFNFSARTPNTCPKLANVASAVVRAIAPLPTTAKIRIGWDSESVNAVRVAKILADAGIAALTVHGRTRAQGYSGAADWNVIGEVAAGISIPVIGNGDLGSANDIAKRRAETGIAGAMIGRAAMSAPWIFRETKAYLATGEIVDPPTLSERWKLILRHCELTAREWGAEEPAIRSMRARLMAYSKSMPEAKRLREKFAHVSTVTEVRTIAEENILNQDTRNEGEGRIQIPVFLGS